MKRFSAIVFSVWVTLSVWCLTQSSVAETDSMLKKANEVLSLADFVRDHHSYGLASTLYSNALNLFQRLSTNNVQISSDVLKFKIVYCENQLEVARSLALKEKQPISSAEHSGTETHSAETSVRSTTSSTTRASVSLLSASHALPSATNINIEIALNKVSALIANNQPAESREILLSVLKVAPDRADARMLMVAVQCALKRFDDAYYIADALVEEMPDNPSCHILKATALFGQGNLNQAELSLLKALELDPHCTEAHFNLAQLFLQMNPAQIEKARYHYMKALSLGAKRNEKLENVLKRNSSTAP